MVKLRDFIFATTTFIVLYGIMILPWPHLNTRYGEYLRSIGSFFFETHTSKRIVRFEVSHETDLDTQIVLAAPDTADAEGNMQARILALDSRGIGWIPMALTLALTLATPHSIPRRLISAAAGTALIHVYVIFTLWVYITNESLKFFTPDHLHHPTRFDTIGDALEMTLVTQLGASIVVPVLIWLLVSFRKRDWENLLAPLRTAQASGPSHS